MTWSIVMAAGKPWTYWFAPVLLITTVPLVVSITVGSFRRVAVPAFQWKLHEEQRRLAELRRQPGTVHRLPGRSASTPKVEAV